MKRNFFFFPLFYTAHACLYIPRNKVKLDPANSLFQITSRTRCFYKSNSIQLHSSPSFRETRFSGRCICSACCFLKTSSPGGVVRGCSLVWAIYRLCSPKGMVFQPSWSEIGNRFWPFLSHVFGTLILNCVSFQKKLLFQHYL